MELDPTSYRIPIRPDLQLETTATHGTPHQKFSSRKRKPSSSDENEDHLVKSLLKKEQSVLTARSLEWTDDSKTALLQCRLHLSRVFENNDDSIAKRAWEKIAAMLDMTCTGEDCEEMFDTLIKEYLVKQKTDFKGVKFESSEWQQYQTLEKLFMNSPKLESYESVELSPTTEYQDLLVFGSGSDNESTEIEKALSERSPFFSCYKKFCNHIKDTRHNKIVLEHKITKILEDLLRIRSENMQLMSEFLKRILFSFNELDELARRESLEALTSIFPALFCVPSVIISAIRHYLKSSTFQSELLESNIVFLMACHRLLYSMIDTPDDEDALYVKFIPFHEQYFIAKCQDESIKNQSSLSEFNFKGHLHVSRSTIEELINLIAPIKAKKVNPLRVPVSIERQMVVFMWYLTHNETCEQLALRFCVLWTEVIVIIRHFIVLINENLNLIHWPTSQAKKYEIISAFESIREDSFPGVIGALGTKYMSVTFPAWFNDPNGKVVRNGKVHQTVAVQAVADANLIFNSLHVVWLELPEVAPGVLKPMPSEETKTIPRFKPADVFLKSPFHFAYCRRSSELQIMDSFFLPEDVHVVADSTYPLMVSVMTPYNKTIEESPSQYLFDQQLHRSRSAVELAFGKLMNRFTRLNFMDYSLLQTEGFIKTCAGIHNFCLKTEDDFDPMDCELPEKPIDGIADPVEAAIAKRDKICDEIYKSKITYVCRNPAPVELPTIENQSSLDHNSAIEES